jgi:hypothetical protein
VKILDFGIAKHRSNLRMTKTGTLMGTPLYMSPEQCRGSVHLDGRSDLYSLGCILYVMLTGTPPFVREGDGIVLIAHLNDPVPPLESHGVSVLPELEATLMKALAKDPMDRQQSMTELVAELDAADASPGRGTMPGREKAGKTEPPATEPLPRSGPACPRRWPRRWWRQHHAQPLVGAGGSRRRARPAAQPARRRWGGGRRDPGRGGGRGAGGGRAAPRAPVPPPVAAQPPVVVTAAATAARSRARRRRRHPHGGRAGQRSAGRHRARSLAGGAARDHAGALTFDRAERVLELRLDKRGFRSETVADRSGADSVRKVALRPRPRAVVDPDEMRKL